MARYEFSYVPLRTSRFPIIPVELRAARGDSWLGASALVDSGASISLFDGSVAHALGFGGRGGRRVEPSGIGGTIVARVHSVTLRIGDEQFAAGVAFTRRRLPVNLLGRFGVFERFLVTFDERNGKTIMETAP
ncbi:MAG: aspartyl protease family protein [Nitrososphaerales archaeon]